MFVAKWYTRASRVRIVIAKFDGRWKLPGGPYPIPELVALVGGVLFTLFMLPRLGQPLLTGLVGVGSTAVAVAAMRRMPYSPVKFGTRVHRIMRLYTGPVSVSGGEAHQAMTTLSAVRPDITILDALAEPAPPPMLRGSARQSSAPQRDMERDWDDLFGRECSTAAELFG
ncbi:hypothetical protein [Mycobacterium paragordonae]|uniref:Uncharacterized protein n=1 Tax=Mycobacterium paragordonae TaxID=1389713 RepID=A0AAJ1S808_9MYCO|nr:hypothetical protein [Mycobacterium paragordonae]MBI2699698.1 hypothetical protein [Mycobacterium sp.]MDP7739256.1 hypothetical protein [Mycobacterium paragordonae]TDL04036.1 hypothetical protein EUA05_22540 [Mycobacterium paragordonae]